MIDSVDTSLSAQFINCGKKIGTKNLKGYNRRAEAMIFFSSQKTSISYVFPPPLSPFQDKFIKTIFDQFPEVLFLL